MEPLLQDLRYAFRQIARSPGFALVVVLTLALGIGANAAIFSLMDQVLFRPLPVKDPDQLVILDAPGPNSGMIEANSRLTPISHPMFEDLRDKNTVFSGVLAFYATAVHLGAGGETEEANAALVSGGFFDVLGVKPAAGRLFTPDDDRTPGGHPLVVLGHGYWLRRFAGDPSVLGRSVAVNGRPMTVIGVAAAGFHGVEVGRAVDVYVPLAMQAEVVPVWKALGVRRVMWLSAMARLKNGVSVDEARAGINVLYHQILEDEIQTIQVRDEDFRKRFVAKSLELLPGGRGTSELRTRSQATLFVLMGMVGLVLLIACANVANLLLARASGRRKEVAVRLSLGAGRARLVTQLLVESLLLSILGGVAGLFVAAWTGSLLIRSLPGEAAMRTLHAEPDLRVAAFAFVLSLLTGVLFGLAPALQATREELFLTLRNEAGSLVGGSGPLRLRKGLVVAQVALSLLLLIGAGLFARSLQNLRKLDPGFDLEALIAFSVDPSLNGYDDPGRIALLTRILDDVSREPGVRSTSLSDIALMTGNSWSSTVRVEGFTEKPGDNMNPDFMSVAPAYLRTVGTPLLAGRDFTEADAAGAPGVALVNESFARFFFKGENPIGRRFGRGRGTDLDITIVGVAKDSRHTGMKDENVRLVYVPFMQQADLGQVTFYVRTASDIGALSARIRSLVRNADAGLPVTDMKTMRAQIGESLFVERMVAALSAAFGLLATALAALGLYGVMSYAVARRTREIGIRMALGAERHRVLGQVLGEVARLAAVGIALGLPAAWGLSRVLHAQLFGLQGADPLTTSAATLILAAVALAAGFLPAHRASRVDPMTALRYE